MDTEKKEDIRIPKYCGSWGWYNAKTKTTSRYYCGSFRCGRDICKKKAYLKRVTEIQNDVTTHSLDRFFTLTLDRTKILDGYNPWEYIAYVWSKFRKRISRIYPDFKYVAVLESHKDRRFPHIHGFTNTYIPYSVYKQNWVECGGGWMVSVCRVDDGEIAEYVSKQLDVVKYVGKQQLDDAYQCKPYRARTIWRSRGLKASSQEKDLTKDKEWYILKECIYDSDGNQIRFVEDSDGANTELKRQDVERTQFALPETRIRAGKQDMETEGSEKSREKQACSAALTACKDKSRYQKNYRQVEQEKSTYG